MYITFWRGFQMFNTALTICNKRQINGNILEIFPYVPLEIIKVLLTENYIKGTQKSDGFL